MNEITKSELFLRAHQGDASILSHWLVASTWDNYSRTPLHVLAQKGCEAVLAHPDVSRPTRPHRLHEWSPLHVLADAGCEATLAHPDVAKVKDDANMTPLHLLAESGSKPARAMLDRIIAQEQEIASLFKRAWNGDASVANHHLASAHAVTTLTQDEYRNKRGETPIHALAMNGILEAMNHPDAATAKDFDNRTVFHHLARRGVVEVMQRPDITETQKDIAGVTPLQYLADHGCEPANIRLRELIRVKAKVEAER